MPARIPMIKARVISKSISFTNIYTYFSFIKLIFFIFKERQSLDSLQFLYADHARVKFMPFEVAL